VRQIHFCESEGHCGSPKPSYLVFFKVLATFPHWTTFLATRMSSSCYLPFLETHFAYILKLVPLF